MKLKKFLLKIAISCTSLLLIGGITPLNKGLFAERISKENVLTDPLIDIKALNRCDSIKNFKKDLTKEGYQSLEISISNPTDKPYILSKDLIKNIELADSKEVIDSIQKSNSSSFSFGKTTLLSSIASIKKLVSSTKETTLFSKANFLSTAYFPRIHKTFEAMKKARSEKTKKQLQETSIKEMQIISPQAEKHFFLFTPIESYEKFSKNGESQIEITLLEGKTLHPKKLEVITK